MVVCHFALPEPVYLLPTHLFHYPILEIAMVLRFITALFFHGGTTCVWPIRSSFFCCIRSSKSLDELVGLARGAPHGTWYWRLSVNPLNPDSGLGAIPLGPGFSSPWSNRSTNKITRDPHKKSYILRITPSSLCSRWQRIAQEN